MKKYIFILLIISICMTISGCGLKNKANNKSNNDKSDIKITSDKVELYSIDLYIAGENENNIYYARYPYHYYQINKMVHKNQLVSYQNKLDKAISKDDFDVFYDFIIKEREKESGVKEGEPIYSISLNYYDEDGQDIHLYLTGYDDFPEELNKVIDKFNELSRENIFSYPTKALTLNSDFIYEKYGINEDLYSREDVDAMLISSTKDLRYFLTNSNSIESYMEYYYRGLEKDKIMYMYSRGIQDAVIVSDDEYNKFVEEFVKHLGESWEVDEYSDQNGLIRIVNRANRDTLYVGKAETLNNYKYWFDEELLQIELNAGMEDMTYTSSFIYNCSNKYILVDFENISNNIDLVKIAEAFYNIE